MNVGLVPMTTPIFSNSFATIGWMIILIIILFYSRKNKKIMYGFEIRIIHYITVDLRQQAIKVTGTTKVDNKVFLNKEGSQSIDCRR